MLRNITVGILLLASAACIHRKQPEQPPIECNAYVEQWGKKQAVHGGQGLPDGGAIVFHRSLQNKIVLLIIASERQIGKLLNDAKTDGKFAQVGEPETCRHPENGYDYKAVTLEKQLPLEEASTLK